MSAPVIVGGVGTALSLEDVLEVAAGEELFEERSDTTASGGANRNRQCQEFFLFALLMLF